MLNYSSKINSIKNFQNKTKYYLRQNKTLSIQNKTKHYKAKYYLWQIKQNVIYSNSNIVHFFFRT